MRSSVLAIALAIAAPVALAAQSAAPDLATIPGVIKPFPPDAQAGWGMYLPADVTSAQKATMKTNLLAIYDVFVRTPVLQHPMGFTVFPFRHTLPLDRVMNDERRALAYNFNFNFIWHWVDQTTHEVHASGDGEGGGFYVTVNRPGCIFGDQAPQLVDAQGPMWYEPSAPADLHGLPWYSTESDFGCVVITKRAQPLFVHVSRERFLRKVIADIKEQGKTFDQMRTAYRQLGRTADIAELDRNDAPRLERLRAFETYLAGMSSTARALPAYVDFGKYATAPPNEVFSDHNDPPYVVGFVTPNPELFDRTLPRTAVQLVTMRFHCHSVGCRDDGEGPFFKNYQRLYRAVLEQLDWHALEALVSGGGS